MDDIQLNPGQNAQAPTVDLGGQEFPVPSDRTSQFKASKASFGLGGLTGKPFGDFYAQIANGMELPMRQEAAAQVDQDKAKRKQAVLTQAVQSGATSDDLKGIAGIPTETDPNSVVEEYHAAQYFQPMLKPSDDLAKNVSDAYNAINAGVTNLTYKNYVVDRLQKSMDNYKNQSWTGWTEDQIKNLSQIYTEYKLRGGFSGDWSGLLGTSLDNERQEAYDKPFDEFKTWFDSRMDSLDKDNPSLALAFGAAMAGQSVADIQRNSLTTLAGVPADLATLAGGAGDAISAARRIRGAVQGVVRSSSIIDPSVGEVIDHMSGRGSTQTMKDVTPQDIKQAQAAGHGDVGEAAVQSVTQDIANRFEQKDNAAQVAVKSLPDVLRTDITDIQKNTGNLGTDVANRIKDQAEARQIDINKAVTELMRVNRTPVVVASEDIARALKDWVKNKYSGANSTVGAVGKDLLYDNASNTYHMSIDIVRHDGEYFPTEAAAVSHAEMYGIPLEAPETSTRRFWEDEATAAAFEVEQLKTQLKRFHSYGKNKFKPKEFYELQKDLDYQNARKRNAWSQRAGAYWKPDQPIEAKLGKITLEQQGKGWFIRGYVPLDETDSVVRDNLLKIPNAWSGPARKANRTGTLTPYLEDLVTGTSTQKLAAQVKVFGDSFLGSAGFEPLRGIRSPEETLSPEENIQRKVATHVPSKLMNDIFGPDVKILEAIPNKQKASLRRLLVANQTMSDPVTHESGYFFKNIGDVENWYQTYEGRFPSEQEVEGYFAYTRMYETERGLRSLAMLRNKWRAGVESHQIKINGKLSEPFDGVIRPNYLPSGIDRSPVYVSIQGSDEVRASGRYGRDIVDGIKDGRYQTVELWDRETKPFHELSKTLTKNTKPRYVITDSLQTRPLDPNKQVPRRGGGHWVFPYDHYMRQAKTYFDNVTKQWIYEGDVTAMPFQNPSLGRQITSHFNEIKNLLEQGMKDDARYLVNHLGVAGLDFDKDVLPMFFGKTRRFSLHEPFELVPADKTIMSQDNRLLGRYEDKGGLLDTTRYGNMARNYSVEFTGERDAWDIHTIEDAGTPNNPIYSYRPAQLADPVDVISRGITRISNSSWLDDYKYMAAEHWYQTYQPWLDVDKGGSPFYHFSNPVFKDGTPESIKQLALSNRKKARDFVYMPSPLATYTHKVMSEAAGAIYDKLGSQAYNMFRPITEVATEKNPLVALKSLTADLKIGLWSIPAFGMQFSAYSNIIAFEPRYVGAATRAALLHTYARLMPQHIDHLDKIASANLRGITGQVSFNPGVFKHLWDGLRTKTDFENVGKEHAYLGDTALNDRYMRTSFDVAKYWGSTFFREAAQFVRLGGWYTSGLKWITENEGRLPQTRDEWAQIQAYATDLDHNMSRASNSSINTGLMSIPSQFLTYDRNIAEDMWGKRFTPIQKARMFLVNASLWGVPFGGLGLWGAPIGYEVNKWFLDHDIGLGKYIPGGNTLQSAFMEGLPALLVATLTGHGDPHKGDWYDFSRFGVKGFLTDIFSNDARWWNALGAMPSVLINTSLRSVPVWQDMAALLHGVSTSDPVNVSGVGPVPGGGGDFSKFNPTAEDFADLLKEWSGFSYAHRMYQTIRTGSMYSNNNTPLMDNATTGQAVTNFITGLVPSDVADIQANFSILGDRKAQKDFLVHQASRDYSLALREAKVNPDLESNEGYKAYMRKVKVILDMAPVTDRTTIAREVFNRNKTLVDVIEQRLATTMATQEDLDKYRKEIELNQGKK